MLPNSPYAASKAAAELLCRAYWRTYDVPVVITRSSNNYGPYQFPEKLIPLMIRNAITGKPLPVYGEGKQVRDWLYVDDNCAGLLAVMEHGKDGEAYNVGGSCEKRKIEVVNTIIDKLRASHPEMSPQIKYIEDPRGAAHDFRYALDSSKLQTELGWEPTVGLEEGMARTIGWYLEHQNWIEDVITGDYQEYYEKLYGAS